MQKLAEICIHRPVFAAMLILALVVVGATAWFNLGVDRFPSVDLPTVNVRTMLPGAAAEEIEVAVSKPLEEELNTIEGIEELRSISVDGASLVLITFALERDIEAAAQDVRDRVASAVRRLPLDTLPPVVGKFDNDSTPVLSLALSGDRPLRELSEIADKLVKVPLERSAGVGEVRLEGALPRAINVWIDPERLAAQGLPITAVRDAIERQNVDVPGGNLTNARQELTLRTMGRVRDPKEFNDLVVAQRGGVPIRIRDIGRAEDGTEEARSFARLNGVPAVALEVRRQSGSNTVAVIQAVKQKLAQVREMLPPDLSLEVIRDQSRYIEAALHEIDLHLILGSIFASLVVLAFMRSLRATIIAAVAIPTSVIATFGMMWALDFTLNGVTMLALVLMVGVVIDDAIVVLENIFRFVEEKKMSPFRAAKEATAEIGLAVLATTLSLVVIFVPVSFMSSISGRFLYQFGITAAVAVMVSLLVSFTLTPTMSARWLRPRAEVASRGGFYAPIERAYLAVLGLAMRWRLPVLLLSALVVASTVPLYGIVKQDYLPTDVDEAEFEVNVQGPEGASVAAMDQAMRAVEAEIAAIPQVRTMLTTVGGSFLGNVNRGGVYVRIAPHEERVFSIWRLITSTFAGDPGAAFRGNRSQRDVMSDVRQRLRKFPDLRCSVRNQRSFNIGGGNFDIDFVLRGPELEPLADYIEQLRLAAHRIGGIVDIDTTLKIDKPELRVEVDRERAADLGVDTQDIALALRLAVGGDQEVSRFRDEALNEDYDVQLRLEERWRQDVDPVLRLWVPRSVGGGNVTGAGLNGSSDGDPGVRDGLVRLDNLVRIVEAKTPSRIDRLDRQRQASLRAAVAPGYALADRLEALRQAAKDLHMPPAYTTTIAGRGRELERVGREFVIAFLLSIAFMYMILAAQFESVLHPFLILLSLPVTIPFALLSLYVGGQTLNLYSALGILVLFGVVKKNAILQIDHMNQLRARGLPMHDAVIQANRDRLRPILMTTLAFVAGMLPLALGTGPGAEERRAIAVVVIGGQTLALVLTLLVTPIAYSLLARHRPVHISVRAREREAGEPRQPTD